MKRLCLSSVLCFILLMSVNVFGQQFAGGDGTQEHPYQIATAEQFATIGNYPAGTYFTQITDIDLNSVGEYSLAGNLDMRGWPLSNVSSLTLRQGSTLTNATIMNGSVIVGQNASNVQIESMSLQGDASFVVENNATVELQGVNFNNGNEDNGITINQGANVTFFNCMINSYSSLTINEGTNVTFEYVNIGGGFSSFTLAQNATLTLKTGIELYDSDLNNFNIQGTIVLDNEEADIYPLSPDWTILRNNMSGIVNDVPLTANQWNFIGLCGNTNLEVFRPLSSTNEGQRVWALGYDYQGITWDNNYLNYSSEVSAGDGIFVFPEQDINLPITSYYEQGNIAVSKTINFHVIDGEVEGWMAMSNPFCRDLYVDALIGYYLNNATEEERQIQGGVIYTRNIDGSSDGWSIYNYGDGGVITPGQGFFVNMDLGYDGNEYSSREFTFTLRGAWCNDGAKKSSKAPSRDFLTVSVSTDGYKVPVMFAQNDMATEGYDIYDANKMFGSGSVAEPYLVCNGIELCKEEVSSANYTATMNIKSSESRSVEIVADNIPEGYSLTLIDGALEVVMNQGDVYTTDIAEGENADRFKLLITKNNVSIADVAEAESIRVVNNNRSIRVYGGKSVRTEVYNAVGQKVYETSDRAFDLNNVASGAYVLRVQDGKSVNSTKIVVE